MNDVTKDLIAAIEAAFREGFRSPTTYNDTVLNSEDEEWEKSDAKAAIARAEAVLAEPKACHQEPLTVRLDPNAPCRNALARDGKPYPKSNCQRCGTLLTAARAVVARWETPTWKDAPATAGFIYELRDAVARAEAALTTTQPDAGLIGVQWWLAELDLYGNPALVDGAHSGRSGADQALYLLKALHLDAGRRFAVARVELSEPKPSEEGVNHEAIKTLNDARREAQP